MDHATSQPSTPVVGGGIRTQASSVVGGDVTNHTRPPLNLFADDTVQFIAAKNPNDVVALLNQDLHCLANWLKFKQLKLNISI